jgi:putative transposase
MAASTLNQGRSGDYPWSSYRTNGQGEANPLLSPQEEYLRQGSTPDARQAAYRELFRAHMEPQLADEIRKATNGNFALGNERFQKEIEKILNRRVVPGKPERPKNTDS